MSDFNHGPSDAYGTHNAARTGATPPTHAGDFVALAPPEGWPTVIGVLSIIFGALATLQAFCGLLGMLLMTVFFNFLPQEVKDQLQTQVQSSMPYPAVQAVQILAEFALAITLLVGGIMLVRRRARAGGLLTVYALLDLLSNTYGAAVGYFVFNATIANAQNDPQMQQMPAGFAGIMQGVGPVMVIVTWIFAAIWPVFLLIWFRRARVRESMDNWG